MVVLRRNDPFLDVGSALKIGLKDNYTWQVWARENSFDLNETADFFRLLVLLEGEYSDVKRQTDDYAERQSAKVRLPLWRIVAAGLLCCSDQWASLALVWVPHLAAEERPFLLDALLEVHAAKWAGQRTRQIAERYAKQIKAAANS